MRTPFNGSWDCSSLKARHARLAFPAGWNSCKEWPEEDYAEEILGSGVIDELFRIRNMVQNENPDVEFLFDFPSANVFFDYYLAKDLRMLGLSFALVFLVLWFATNSAFLALCGMFEIVVSFPLGLFIWLVLLQQPGVTYLMYNGIFIILGIGCDDIFVFVDAFRQSELEDDRISGSLETRFAWAYNRAAGAMLATSITTTLAFLGCATSQIWDIRCFGVVNGMMVLFDYLLVITWFPAAVIVHERYLKGCMGWCTPQHLLAKVSSCCRKGTKKGIGKGGEALEMGHFLENLFGGPFAKFIVCRGKALVYLFWGILIASTVVWVMYLKPAEDSFTFFNEDHFYERAKTTWKDKFAFSSVDGKIQVTMAFGLNSKDPWSDGGEHPTVVNGEVYKNTKQSANYLENFDLFDYQEAFPVAAKEFHDQLVARGQAKEDDGYYCWVDDFKLWTTRTHGLPFPYNESSAFLGNVSGWLAAGQDEGYSWANRSWWKYSNYKGGTETDFMEGTGFDVHGGKVRFAFALFNTTHEDIDGGQPGKVMRKLYNRCISHSYPSRTSLFVCMCRPTRSYTSAHERTQAHTPTCTRTHTHTAAKLLLSQPNSCLECRMAYKFVMNTELWHLRHT